MPFAFDDFLGLVGSIPCPEYELISPHDHRVRYACALLSELAYYHVPNFELEFRKRAKLIPCEAYRMFIRNGFTMDVEEYLRAESRRERGFRVFVIVDRGIVAVGVLVDTKLFIGLRGTVFLFDWLINLRAPLVPIASSIFMGDGHYYQQAIGRCHLGFAEETVRISARISKQMREWKDQGIEVRHGFLSGHPLGGAVAAISENLLVHIIGPIPHIIERLQTITIGAPRYCDVTAYSANMVVSRVSRVSRLPIQIRRPGDIVPCLPLRRMGYADHPLEYNTAGEPFSPGDIKDHIGRYVRWCAALLVFKFLKTDDIEVFRKELTAHDIEVYRKEVWKTCYAHHPNYPNGDCPLTDHKKLKK